MKHVETLSLPMWVFFGLYVIAGFSAPLLHQHWWTVRGAYTAPPWYFIGGDLVSGALFAVALAVSLLVAFLTRHQHPEGSRLAAFMALLWMGYPVAQGLLILWRTSYVWDASRATSGWRTFDEYVGDPTRWIGFALAVGVAGLFFVGTRRFTARHAGGGGDDTK